VDSIVRQVNGQLPPSPDGDPWLIFDNGLLILADRGKLIKAGGGMDVDSMLTQLAARLRTVPGVARVDRPALLLKEDSAGDVIARRWVHEIPPDAGVELTVTLKPWSIWASGGTTTHGQPSDLDAHIPLIFWGRGIERGTYAERVASVDIAPTLARLLDITPAEPLDGRVLTDVIARADSRQP
jgi:arylsulfatase A-like enzyme